MNNNTQLELLDPELREWFAQVIQTPPTRLFDDIRQGIWFWDDQQRPIANDPRARYTIVGYGCEPGWYRFESQYHSGWFQAAPTRLGRTPSPKASREIGANWLRAN